MKALVSFLRLIRWINLLYIALTQYLVQYTLIKPILAQAGKTTTLGDLHFLLLVISTVLVAAGGYVINDYFDVKMDEVNKPRRIFIDRTIHHRSAILLHQVLTAAGVSLAFYVAWQAANFKLAFLHMIIAAFLWFYSTGYKRQVLLGNIIIAFLSGIVILLPGLYERNLFIPQNAASVHAAYSIFIILFFYFVFAFILSLARELSKDIQDMEGDRLHGCRTLPIVAGINKSRWIIAGYLSIVLILLTYIQVLQIGGHDMISAYTIFSTLQFPVLITFYLLYIARVSSQFSMVSSLIKITMLMGILSMLYFYFLTGHGSAW